jgi:hypothetical protein
MLTSYDIPKKLHLYWGKNDNLSKLHYKTVTSFLKHNPDWEVIIWFDSNYSNKKTWATPEQKINYTGENYFPNLFNLKSVSVQDISSVGIKFSTDLPEVKKSDIFRYFILYHMGGVYSDFDILYLRSLNNILEKFESVKQDKLLITFNTDYFNIAFIGANKGNAFYKKIYSACAEQPDINDYQAYGTKLVLKLYPTLENVKEFFPNMEIVNLNNDLIYPFAWNETEKIFLEDKSFQINKDCIGIHWFNGSDLAKKYLNNSNQLCTISKIMEQNNL